MYLEKSSRARPVYLGSQLSTISFFVFMLLLLLGLPDDRLIYTLRVLMAVVRMLSV